MDALGVEFVNVDVEKALRKERKQRKKEKKKLRKEKKNKHSEKPASSPDASTDSEKPVNAALGEYDAPEQPKTARDDWMTAASQDRNILTGEKLRAEEKEDKPADDKPKVSAKELNPVMSAEAERKPRDPRNSAVPAVGDGGASWRLKALKRAQALAEAEGKNVDDVVSERYESLAKLTEQLTTQRAAHSKAHLHAQRDRLRQKDGGEAAGYLQDIGTSRSQMRRPDASKSLSWRRDKPAGGTEPRGRPRGNETKRDDRPRAEKPFRRDSASREDESRGGHSAKDDKSSREHGRSETGSDRRPPSEFAAGDGRRPRQSERSRPQKDPLGCQEDATVLRAAAASLNAFESDGRFLERFQNEAADELAAHADPSPEDAGLASQGTDEIEPRTKPAPPVAAPAADAADGSNKSAAAALRARLLGKSAAQPSGAAAAKSAASSGPKRKQVEVLPSVDAEGRAMPGAFGREAAGQGLPEFGRKPKKLQRYEGGEKQRYYADDDGKSLDDLVREQRHGGGTHADANLAENIARKARFRERDLDVDLEYDVDGGLDMYESRNKKVTKEKAVQRQRASQISDLRRSNNAMDACNLCFGSSKRSKHLTIAIGQTAYLCIPSRSRLTQLHCCIVPMDHISSSRRVDEHVWTEMRNFKKCIIQMYRAQGLNAVFYETAMRLSDLRSHAIVHCVPLDDEAFHRGPIVFRKALQEAESEWSQHHAKAVIDTRAKGLMGSVPPNFPYFFVEFGLSEGLLHVVDNEEKFDRDFGRSVMAGLLKLGAEAQHRGSRPEAHPVQQRLATEFAGMFDPYDWTKQLE